MSTFSPSQLAVMNARFEGVTRKMANTLLRTGRSGVLNRARDFSCCIVTAEHQLLTAAESLPIHVLSGPDIMSRCMVQYHAEMKPGDAFLNNSPYHGCSHAADHTLLIPVFDDSNRHRFTVLAKAHQADIGNSIPTTYFGAARDVYEEGALVFPCVQIQRHYENIEDIVRMCEARIRVPEQWRGDSLAMMGAARMGEREIQALARNYGWEALNGFAQDWFRYSNDRMAAAIRRLPEGKTASTSIHDALPGVLDEEIHVRAEVSIVPEMITVDLRDNPDCLPCGLNLSEACARTAALVGVFNSIDSSVPKNWGSFESVDVRLRENCAVGIPRHPASCSAATTNLADRVTNAVQSAFAKLGAGLGMAEIGVNLPAARGVIAGIDPRTERHFVNQIFLGASGGGASPAADGWLHYAHAGNGGMGFLDSVEQAELYQPIHIHERRIIPDSGGPGRTRGAVGKHIAFSAVDATVSLSFLTDGQRNPPGGVLGGMHGAPAHQYIERADGTKHELDPCRVVELQPGEIVHSCTCGGGGYGAPGDRDRRTVRHDLEEGYITEESARAIYGLNGDDD